MDLAIARIVHVLAVVLWIGGVGFVTTVLFPAIRRAHAPEQRLAAFVQFESAFSWQAKISVALARLTLRRRLPDDLPRLRAAAAEMLGQADVIVVIGGASVGERDFSRAMFETSGLQLLFSKVAMRPGKPVWFGRAGDVHIIGLPGNPTAALVTARLFLAPLIAGLAGRDAHSALAWRPRPLAEGLEASQQWECFIGARLEGERARPLSNRDSSGQKALAATELLIRRRAGQPTAATGDVVQTLDF